MRRVAIALACASVVALAGCGNNDDDSSAPVSNCAVPSSRLVVGVNVPYAPNEFRDASGALAGFDVDLLNAVAHHLGMTVDYRESDFEKIIPAIQACTYSMGMSSFSDTKARERQVDFVTYFSAGVQWAQRAGGQVDPANACGKKVAVQSTTIEDTDDVPAKSAACEKAGKPAIEKVRYDSQDQAMAALLLGNVDAMAADSPVTAYAIKQNAGKLVPAGGMFGAQPYGWPVPRGSALGPRLQSGMQALIDSGEYRTIAAKWGVESGIITRSVINGATS